MHNSDCRLTCRQKQTRGCNDSRTLQANAKLPASVNLLHSPAVGLLHQTGWLEPAVMRRHAARAAWPAVKQTQATCRTTLHNEPPAGARTHCGANDSDATKNRQAGNASVGQVHCAQNILSAGLAFPATRVCALAAAPNAIRSAGHTTICPMLQLSLHGYSCWPCSAATAFAVLLQPLRCCSGGSDHGMVAAPAVARAAVSVVLHALLGLLSTRMHLVMVRQLQENAAAPHAHSQSTLLVALLNRVALLGRKSFLGRGTVLWGGEGEERGVASGRGVVAVQDVSSQHVQGYAAVPDSRVFARVCPTRCSPVRSWPCVLPLP